jgi:hypothetical protein
MVRFTFSDRSERNARRRPTSPRANGVADGGVRRRQAVAPDLLDAAVLMPGRFDRGVAPDRPDVRGRADLLRIHAGTHLLSPAIDFIALARRTAGFSGAELVAVVNQAALLATRRGADLVSQTHFFEAIESVRAARTGPPPQARRSPAPADEANGGGAGAGAATEVCLRGPAFVPEQLASFRDIGNWLSPGLAGGL